MAIDLAALRSEFVARGFAYVDSGGTTRQDYFLNRGYHRICEEADWPFLQVTATGTAPVSSLTDIRDVLYVVDTTNHAELTPRDAGDIAFEDPDITTSGTPLYWWLDGETVKVYPTSAVGLSIRYTKVPADLATGTDQPLIPSRYRLLIVDAAVLEAEKDKGPDPDEYRLLQADYDRRIADMKGAYLNRNGAIDYIRPVVSGWVSRT